MEVKSLRVVKNSAKYHYAYPHEPRALCGETWHSAEEGIVNCVICDLTKRVIDLELQVEMMQHQFTWEL